MIVLPGGGYSTHADHEADDIAVWLNALGINAAVLRYPVAPSTHPAAIGEARHLLRRLRDGSTPLNGDTHRIGVIGFSAGGHLAALLSAAPTDEESIGFPDEDGRPDLAILAYPVISWIHDVHQGSLESFFGDVPVFAQRQKTSAEFLVDAATPPTFLWHTADDGGVSVRHSLRYGGALSEQAIPFELHVFERGEHGKGLARDLGPLEAWTHLARTWLDDRGWLSA